jgi:hypothetical protein
MDDGYNNPIILKDKLLVRFTFSSCCIYAYLNKKNPFKKCIKDSQGPMAWREVTVNCPKKKH